MGSIDDINSAGVTSYQSEMSERISQCILGAAAASITQERQDDRNKVIWPLAGMNIPYPIG